LKNEKALALIDTADLGKLKSREIRSLAEQAAREILLKIKAAADRIETAKSDAEGARNMKTGWFGKTSKKADATSRALVRTNEAVADMNGLIQESIRFTQLNSQLSKAMHLAMSRMVVDGFENHKGELVNLNESGEEFAQILVEEAESFSEKQFEIERLQAQQAEELHSVASESERLALELGQDIERLKQQSEDHTQRLKQMITRKSEAILSRSDANDELHQELIEGLQESTRSIRQSSDEQDRIHSAQIAALQQLFEQQHEQLAALEEAQPRHAPRPMAWAAIALAVCALLVSGYAVFQ